MKLTLFALFLLSVIAFASCRKASDEPGIKEYDQQQIQNYISANGLTGMKRDTAGGDTTGIYYQILTPGTGARVDYPDTISYVYTYHSFDGKYSVTDTVLNHVFGYLGHVGPNGLMLAIRNDLKYKGGKIRILIPSHLAYGVDGFGNGSNTVTNNRLAGNQCLDYVINLVNNQITYDDMVLNNYKTANNLNGYTKIPPVDPVTGQINKAAGMWYKIITPGNGNSINDNSSVTCNYKLLLMNNTYADTSAATNTATFSDLKSLTQGVHEGLKLVKGGNGSAISMLVPSRLGYGTAGASGIPANSCLRFEFYNITVTNY
ncbi:FKBP-type peptidyl-prolyl cis-trans isomerase [Mucilaginibacter sp. McL0603]|uniref:FKBP-type peptidyl-prolyl cis-trans isomerase n=1 Tax=Mucilaginibacter sp. McL0603 TaxID=3415670 RepID=UPI003CFAFDB5